MTKRALVIASQIQGLVAADADAHDVGDALAARGFEVVRLTGPAGTAGAGTRAAIVAAYEDLIAAGPGLTAAVVYYAGHGFYTQLPSEPTRRYQCIAPVDFDTSTDDDWHGITSWELSVLQQRLTEAMPDGQPNVTVILDCCHASMMSRDGAARAAIARALPHPERAGFAEHLAALRGKYGDVIDRLDGLGNPDAVRLVACGRGETAYECYADADQRYHGIFTRALLAVLAEAGDAVVSWATLAAVIRARVLRECPSQRPDVEGPSGRRPFALDELSPSGVVPVMPQPDGSLRIPAGALHGTGAGDVYGLMPPGQTEYVEQAGLGEATVEQVEALRSQLVRGPGAPALPADAVAIPLRRTARRRPIAITVGDQGSPHAEAVAAAVSARPTLRVAEAGEPPIATVHLDGDRLVLRDSLGPLFDAFGLPAELPGAITNLANLAAAARLRELEGADGLDPAQLAIELGTVVDGQLRPIPDHGCGLAAGDSLYVQVTNRSPQQVFVHVLAVNPRGEIQLLSIDNLGYELRRDETYRCGCEDNLDGLQVSWPERLDRSTPRTDELFVIVSSAKVDLHALETTAVQAIPKGGSHPLLDELAQVKDGLPRSVERRRGRDRYLVKRLSFELHPTAAAMRGPFEIDDNPTGLAAAADLDAWIPSGGAVARGRSPRPASGRIAVLLTDLVVEHNGALFFGADLRIDAVVCTRSPRRAEVCTPWTELWRGVRDGDRFPGHHVRLFDGPVHDFVDLGILVSRDDRQQRDLFTLLQQHATSPDFTAATGALVLAGGGAAAAPWIGAVGASAVLIRMAFDVVRAAAGKTIGLYRTSFLASDGFGVGRHPFTGTYRAQKFSFAIEIRAVP